jgi:hypothetical protein
LNNNVTSLVVDKVNLESRNTEYKTNLEATELKNNELSNKVSSVLTENAVLQTTISEITKERDTLKSNNSELNDNIQSLKGNLNQQKAENVEAEAKKLANAFANAKDKYHNSRKFFGVLWSISIVLFIIYLFKNPLFSEDIKTNILLSRWSFSLLIFSGITFISNQYIKADRNYDDFHNREVVAHSTKAFLQSSDSEELVDFKNKLLIKIPDILFKKIELRKKNDSKQIEILEKILETVVNNK